MDKKMKKQLGKEFIKRQNKELNIEEKKSLADGEKPEIRSSIPDVAGIVNPKERRVNTYQKYNTYQALFDIYSNEEMSDEELYKRVVYYIVKWIRNRIVQSGLSGKEEYSDFMRIPEIDQIDLFDMSPFENIKPHFDLDVRTYGYKEDGIWTLCLTELGLRQEQNYGREFISDVSVTRKTGRTVLGIRIACKEPADAEGEAKVMRPAFVRNLWRDSKLVITEHDIPIKFAFRFIDKGNEAKQNTSINEPLIEGSPIEINGNSEVECMEFTQKLVLNEKRQIPILLCPIEEYDNNRNNIDHLSQSLIGYCHVVVIKGSVNKLFGKMWGRQDYIQVYQKGNFILHREKASNGMEPYYYSLAEKVYEILRNEIKQFQLKKNYQFGDYCFYAELREKFLRSVGEDTEDPGTQYDVENNSFAIEGTSSGSGATDIYKDKYTIDISEYNNKKNKVIMDIHMKKGKGQADINRIYFYYDEDIQKTIIGYMPDHLPTRGNPT